MYKKKIQALYSEELQVRPSLDANGCSGLLFQAY
jgi:hypothetical protein